MIKNVYHILLDDNKELGFLVKYVWNSLSTIKYSLICCPPIIDRLKTHGHLARLGLIIIILCHLFGVLSEIISHLFFECQFNSRCLVSIPYLACYWMKCNLLLFLFPERGWL